VSTVTKKASATSPGQQSRLRGKEFEDLAVKRLKSIGLVRAEKAKPYLSARQWRRVAALVEALRAGYVVLGYDTQAEGLFWNNLTGRLVLVEASGALKTSDRRHGLFRGDSARKVVGSLAGAASVCHRAGLRPDGLIITNGLPDIGSTAGCYLHALALNVDFHRFSTEWLKGGSQTRPKWTSLTRRELRAHLEAGQWSPRNQQYSELSAA